MPQDDEWPSYYHHHPVLLLNKASGRSNSLQQCRVLDRRSMSTIFSSLFCSLTLSLSLSLYILYILCVPFDLTFSPLLLLLRDVNDDLKKFL